MTDGRLGELIMVMGNSKEKEVNKELQKYRA
jgi:hypothetical protein